jgi:Ca2+-binding EF-hand superfamily protein
MDFDAQETLNEVWREFDPTLSKRISLEQLRYVFLALGKDISDKDLNAVTKGGTTGSLDMLREFLALMPRIQTSPQDISNSVTVLSQYTGGQLKTVELRLLLTTQGERLTNDEAAALVSDADPRQTGFVDVNAFTSAICKE